jgi:hypothetical protein
MILGNKNDFITRYKLLFYILLVIAIIGFILVMPSFFKLVEFLGQRIPQKDIRLDYIKGFLWAVFLGLTILICPIRSPDKKALLWIWVIKCFVMLGLMLYFEYHYQIDSFNYFLAARVDISRWNSASWGPNFSPTFITWLQRHFFLDSYHAVKVSFGMIGLAGVYIFYRSVVAFLKKEKVWLLYFFALFPSILFWSSILGKDPLVFLLIAIYCYGAIKWFRRGSLSYLFCALLGVLLISFFKSWMGPILVLPLLISTLVYSLKNRKIKIAAIILLSIATVYFIGKFTGHFRLRSSKDLIAEANVKSYNFAKGGSSTEAKGTETKPLIKLAEKDLIAEANVKSYNFAKGGSSTEAKGTETKPLIKLAEIERVVRFGKKEAVKAPEIQSIAKPVKKEREVDTSRGEDENMLRFNNLREIVLILPRGIFTVLFRPLPGEVNNIFGFFAGIEGTFLFIFFVLAMKRLRWQELLDPIMIWAILLIVFWAFLYAFVGFNLGTVCRYRLQILPVFLGLLLYQARDRSR